MGQGLDIDRVLDAPGRDAASAGRPWARAGHPLVRASSGGAHRGPHGLAISAYKRALAPKGTYVMAGGSPAQVFQALFLGRLLSRAGGRRVRVLSAKPNQKDLAVLSELLESGRVVPVIDWRYSLAEVPEALRYLGQGHARGKVVIAVDHTGE